MSLEKPLNKKESEIPKEIVNQTKAGFSAKKAMEWLKDNWKKSVIITGVGVASIAAPKKGFSQNQDKILKKEAREVTGYVGVPDSADKNTVHVVKIRKNARGNKTIIKDQGELKVVGNSDEKINEIKKKDDQENPEVENKNNQPANGLKLKPGYEIRGNVVYKDGKPFGDPNVDPFIREKKSETKSKETQSADTITVNGKKYVLYTRGSESPFENGKLKPNFIFKDGKPWKEIN